MVRIFQELNEGPSRTRDPTDACVYEVEIPAGLLNGALKDGEAASKSGIIMRHEGDGKFAMQWRKDPPVTAVPPAKRERRRWKPSSCSADVESSDHGPTKPRTGQRPPRSIPTLKPSCA